MSTSVVTVSTSCVLLLMSTLDSIPSTSIANVSSSLPNILSPTSIYSYININVNNDDNSSRLVQIDQFEDPGFWPNIISQDFRTQIID